MIAHVDPLYYGVEAARDLSAGALAATAVVQGSAVLGVLTVVTLGWATRVYARALR